MNNKCNYISHPDKDCQVKGRSFFRKEQKSDTCKDKPSVDLQLDNSEEYIVNKIDSKSFENIEVTKQQCCSSKKCNAAVNGFDQNCEMTF